MKLIKNTIVLLILLIHLNSVAQSRLEGSFFFKGELKQYSLFIPENWEPGMNAVLAFHPLNTTRWNSTSWCDTLVSFAKDQTVLLICPDGGVDGRVDDPVDLEFTSALLDSTDLWYQFNTDSLVALGFSWGARTVYTYGLANPSRFRGLIAIGAAIEGTNQLNGLESGAKFKNIFIIHGTNDDVNNRYWPAKQFFSKTQSCYKDSLLRGIGHTIDFTNRNSIIAHAYKFTLRNECLISSISEETMIEKMGISFLQNTLTLFSDMDTEIPFIVFDLYGKRLFGGFKSARIQSFSHPLKPGIYLIKLQDKLKYFFVHD
ncbi:MAG: hypothetical protein IPI50_05765 [Saprospiraceae bacterium]|nr:hypothetical protein [Saprospiraceae bacterium]